MQNRLRLVAIDEAYIVYDWQDFRPSYEHCEEQHGLLPGIPIMALSATVAVEVENLLLISWNMMNCENIYLAADLCNYKMKDGS